MSLLSAVHERDALLRFDAGPHKYTITTDLNSDYTSVTTWVHSHFSAFDAATVAKGIVRKQPGSLSPYYGKSVDEIVAEWALKGKAAAQAGTALHLAIENFYKTGDRIIAAVDVQPAEFAAFLRFHDKVCGPDNGGLIPYKSEWMIFNEDDAIKLAGSIDMVYQKADGTLVIYDWKRIKELKKCDAFGKTAITPALSHLPDTNYWHYALQLNTYKAILEAKYGVQVSGLYLVCFLPTSLMKMKMPEVVKVPDLSREIAEVWQQQQQRH